MVCLSCISFSKIVRDYYPLVVLIVGLFMPHGVLNKQSRPERIALSIPNAQNKDSHTWIWSCIHLIHCAIEAEMWEIHPCGLHYSEKVTRVAGWVDTLKHCLLLVKLPGGCTEICRADLLLIYILSSSRMNFKWCKKMIIWAEKGN